MVVMGSAIFDVDIEVGISKRGSSWLCAKSLNANLKVVMSIYCCNPNVFVTTRAKTTADGNTTFAKIANLEIMDVQKSSLTLPAK